ncbi:hypothetical protein [Actinomadura macra]|uniref:hypothetical protein n=1 Tax=Actinomadura macra TaxID=46164 RepID=UPI00082A7F3A|nr:hypothetical protein [Actinomadura macra]
MRTLNAITTKTAVAVINRRDQLIADLCHDRDRGSSTVETIIIVAGFAGLAFTVYLAVSGKVHAWINKIPGASGP